MTPGKSPFTTNAATKLIDFETEDGIFGFRYESLRYYRWETQSRNIGPHALHLFFNSATVSVVGHELKSLLPLLRKQVLSEIRLGQKGKLAVTYIAVLPQDGRKKHEGVDRGIAR